MNIVSECDIPIEVVADSAPRPWRGFRVMRKQLTGAAECSFAPTELSSGSEAWNDPPLDGELPSGENSTDYLVTLGRAGRGMTGIELDGRWYDLTGADHNWVLHPGEVMGRYVWHSRVESTHMLFSQELLDGVARELGYTKSASVRLQPAYSTDIPGFVRALDHLADLAVDEASGDALLAETIAHAFIAHLLDRCTDVTQGRRRRIERLPVMTIRRVHERIESGLDAPLDLTVLAQTAGMSNYHFARAFKHTTGRSPHEYVMARRLERAAALISGTSRSVTEIALECGFATPSHLTAKFRGRFGVVPSEWRRAR